MFLTIRQCFQSPCMLQRFIQRDKGIVMMPALPLEICESLAAATTDPAIVTKAVSILVLLYRNLGETEKAAVPAAFDLKVADLLNNRVDLPVAVILVSEEFVYRDYFPYWGRSVGIQPQIENLTTN